VASKRALKTLFQLLTCKVSHYKGCDIPIVAPYQLLSRKEVYSGVGTETGREVCVQLFLFEGSTAGSILDPFFELSTKEISP
jgi:hypothetical protein